MASNSLAIKSSQGGKTRDSYGLVIAAQLFGPTARVRPDAYARYVEPFTSFTTHILHYTHPSLQLRPRFTFGRAQVDTGVHDPHPPTVSFEAVFLQFLAERLGRTREFIIALGPVFP
jgi:hypothetical protein